jgi:transcriptional regulator GlxA family with amidase domain
MDRLTLSAHRARISGVAGYVATHLDEPLLPAAAARMSGLSVRQFQRVFARVAGEGFKARVLRLRLERAARQLRSTRRSVLAIALDAGFGSHEAFLRAFWRRFSVTPTEFRNRDRRGGRNLIRGSATETWQRIFAAGLRAYVESGAGIESRGVS